VNRRSESIIESLLIWVLKFEFNMSDVLSMYQKTCLEK